MARPARDRHGFPCRCASQEDRLMRPVAMILGVALFGIAFADAGEAREMTVDALVAEALATHPELQAARLEIDAAGARVEQAGFRPNPTLGLGGQKALGPDHNVTIGLTLPLDL